MYFYSFGVVQILKIVYFFIEGFRVTGNVISSAILGFVHAACWVMMEYIRYEADKVLNGSAPAADFFDMMDLLSIIFFSISSFMMTGVIQAILSG
mmetsp:Transcript_4836/g.8296  ORF Transcript_4836/g.8296 Transcript_4836/m.8296 type:complete len:95 (+) Transcript_4836:90-374(+)